MKMTTKKTKYILSIIFTVIIACSSKFAYDKVNTKDEKENATVSDSLVTTNESDTKKKDTNSTSDLNVYFIDVGQADSILIEQNNKFMLIDAGNNDDGKTVVDFLKSKGVSKLDYIIGTHVHEDHIGGMDDVISSFDEDKILFPKTTSTTRTFEDFVKAVKDKNKKLYAPKSGEEFNFANSTFKVLAPNNEEYDEANNYSIAIRLTYKNKSFLFMGDAETLSENEILSKGYDVKSDFLKVGHHGSSTSTSDKFLKAVNPSYAVISVGKNNTYNLPKKSVMDRLKKYNISVYRTDEQGNITLTSDGNTINFDKQKGRYSRSA